MGGYREQGRSSFALKSGNKYYLFDAGVKKVYSEGRYGEPPYLELLNTSKIEAVFISHLHEDHMAMAPWLFRNGYNGPLYMSKPTADLGIAQWYKWAELFEKQGTIYYTSEDCDEARKHIKIVSDREKINIDELEVLFYQSGHAIGSMSLDITTDKFSIFYAADINIGSSVLEDPELPNKTWDVMIINSSYGDQIINQQFYDKMIEEVILHTLKENGKVLIPVTAIGRGQEMVAFLFKHKEIIENASNIFVEKSIMEGFEKISSYESFLKREFKEILKHKPYLKPPFTQFVKEEALDITTHERSIILATDLMLMGTSQQIFMKIKNHQNSAVILTGYQAPGTFGRHLLEFKDAGAFVFDNSVVDFSCRVYDIPVKMHFDAQENLELVQRSLAKNGIVILHHGEEPKSLELHYFLSKYIKPEQIYVPLIPSSFFWVSRNERGLEA